MYLLHVEVDISLSLIYDYAVSCASWLLKLLPKMRNSFRDFRVQSAAISSDSFRHSGYAAPISLIYQPSLSFLTQFRSPRTGYECNHMSP